MVKKSGINISAVAVIRIILFVMVAFILFSIYVRTMEFFTTSPIFMVRNVSVDSSIQFIDTRALKQLKGRNIFKVDINGLNRQFAAQYPQIAQLRVVRQFPDQIKVLAKNREPFAQVALHGKYLVIDTDGASLYYVAQALKVPVFYGIPLDRSKVVLGARVPARSLDIGLAVLNEFKNRPRLRKLDIISIDGANPSKIDITLAGNAHIILDQDQTLAKIDMLEKLLQQNRVDFNRIKYIDVRFKEPIIADTSDDTKHKE